MKDQFNTFFKGTDFDIDAPKLGHLDRFEKRLNLQEEKKRRKENMEGCAQLNFGYE